MHLLYLMSENLSVFVSCQLLIQTGRIRSRLPVSFTLFKEILLVPGSAWDLIWKTQPTMVKDAGGYIHVHTSVTSPHVHACRVTWVEEGVKGRLMETLSKGIDDIIT